MNKMKYYTVKSDFIPPLASERVPAYAGYNHLILHPKGALNNSVFLFFFSFVFFFSLLPNQREEENEVISKQI